VSSVAVRVVLAAALLLIQIPAAMSIRRLPADNSGIPYRVTWIVFMLATTLCSVALVASVAVTLVES